MKNILISMETSKSKDLKKTDLTNFINECKDRFSKMVHIETVVLLSRKKPDGHINAKVEFDEGEEKSSA